MGFIELFLIGIGLSMDAFAASVCKGIGMKKINYKQAMIIALFFGGFQALMPLIGWFLGSRFEEYIVTYDHWITFILLGVVGGKMIFDAVKGGEDGAECGAFNMKEIALLAVATSVDALAVGISFAFNEVNIFEAITTIGITTFVLCVFGVVIGNKFGLKYKNKATFAGGAILVLIGLKILLEHLGVINF